MKILDKPSMNLTESKVKVFPKYYFFKIVFLAFTLFLISLWSLASGEIQVSFSELMNLFFNKNALGEETLFILHDLRLVRIVLGIIVGLSLSLSGMVLQGVFRNPLVDPFIIGISGGASLGAGISILFSLNFTLLGISTVPLFAFAGAMAAMMFTYQLSLVGKKMYIDRLLLGGIAISSLTSSLLSLLLVLRGENANAVIFWIMGSLAGKDWESIRMILPYIVVVSIIIIFNLQKLNVLQLGEESAMNLGINTERLKICLILLSSLLAAAIVSVSGVIGFIGLIVPQMARLFIKSSDYRILFPAVVLLGAIVLVSADSVARLILMPQEIPVGIFTSMLGVPFFLFLLKKSGRG